MHICIKLLTAITLLLAAGVATVRQLNRTGSVTGSFTYADTSLDISGQVHIITGANTGLGRDSAKILAQMGATVIMACRSLEKCNDALVSIQSEIGKANLECLELDLSSFQSIDRFVDVFNEKYDRLDVLMNNAAVISYNGLTIDGLGFMMGVNHYGVARLTIALLPELIKQQGRIVVVASSVHSGGVLYLDDIDMSGEKFINTSDLSMDIYSSSKLANILFTQTLSQKLIGSGVTVNSLCPGFVTTELGRDSKGLIKLVFNLMQQLIGMTPFEGAQNQVYVATSPKLEKVTGEYFQHCEVSSTKNKAAEKEDKTRDALWDDMIEKLKIKDFESWRDL